MKNSTTQHFNKQSAVEPITITVEGAAEMTGMSPWWIRKGCSDGSIQSCCLGGRRMIAVSALRKLINDALAGKGPLARQRHHRGEAAIAAKRAAS